MTAKEIFKKVRKIEIKTRGLSRQVFSGQYHSVFKGRGMAFSEVREYQYGDDVRAIDWNVTARFNKPYIKIFEEERELTVMLLIDISGSNNFGTNTSFKLDVITEIAAVLAFSAIQNNDKVGVIFFSDKIEKFIPPKKGSSHILRIIRELVDFKADNKGTNIAEALKYLTNAIKKRCTAFLISDFMCDNYTDALKIASNKHDLIAIRVSDERESVLPNVGMLQLKDAETDESIWIDTSSKEVRNHFSNNSLYFANKMRDIVKKSGVDLAEVSTGEDYVVPLMKMFKKREGRL